MLRRHHVFRLVIDSLSDSYLRIAETVLTTNIAPAMPAPTVVTRSKVSLADHLDLKELPLATTPAGRTFALKALHPADPEIKINRGPGTIRPTLAIASDMLDTLPFPSGATAACLVQTPNIYYPLTVFFVNAGGSLVSAMRFSNKALGGPGVETSPTGFAVSRVPMDTALRSMEAYRVTAQSITCDVIAPALSDQGTIVSAQYVDNPLTVQPTTITSEVAAGPDVITLCRDLWMWNPRPNPVDLLMGTTAYSGKAREGFYQPLKLDKFDFIHSEDTCIYMNVSASFVSDGMSTSMTSGNYPIFSNAADVGTTTLTALPKPSSNVIGISWIEGTAGNPQVSLRVRVRQVIEAIPRLGTTYAPMAESPLPPDELAYRMVAEISGRMKDAYPASYNDLGKLKDTILKIGKSVLKYADPVLDVLSAVPGVGAVASGLRVAKRVVPLITQGVASMGKFPAIKQPIPVQRPQAAVPQPQKRKRNRTKAKKVKRD